MKKIYLLQKCFIVSIGFLLCNYYVQAQTNIFPATGSVGIGTTTPNASSILDIVSTSKGMLVPRMTKNQRDAIVTPATGLLIYVTNGVAGFYYYSGTAWKAITPKAGWLLTGNAGTDPATNFIGTTDVQPVVFKVNNQNAGYLGTSATTNTAFGYQTLSPNASGVSNTANGFQALSNNNSGAYNSANGAQALYANTSGNVNTANGFWALTSNTTGYYNTAAGGYAMQSNIGGIGNTANGISALRFNTNGNDNTADGANALYQNITGYGNVALGSNALFNNTAGSHLVAVGDSALYNQSVNPLGNYGNVAVGCRALYSNTTGDFNTAIGLIALYSNNAGQDNTASGYGALYYNTGSGNTAFGSTALGDNIGGNNNTAVGYAAGPNSDWSNSSAFGYGSLITASNQVRIGNNLILSIGGNKEWTNLSDGRVKKNIKENVPGLAFINLLKPITYNLDLDAADKITQRPAIKDGNGKFIQPSQDEINARRIQQQVVCTGFIAQDVEATAKKIGYDFDGVDAAKNGKDLYGLRYSEFVVPLVKAVQELSAALTTQKKINEDLQNQINDLKVMITGKAISATTQNAAISTASLSQNIPNPFSAGTTISYVLPQTYSSAYIMVSDQNGRSLKQITLSAKGSGNVDLHASTLASGAYSYSLIVDEKLIDTKKMVLAK